MRGGNLNRTKKINVARKITLFRSATQFAHTCGSLGEFLRFMIIEGYYIIAKRGQRPQIVEFIFCARKIN